MEMEKEKIKTGLVLPGGGARGAYQIGVLKAIAELLPEKRNNPFEERRRFCPFSQLNSPKIDYKDTKLLIRYISEKGKNYLSHELTFYVIIVLSYTFKL